MSGTVVVPRRTQLLDAAAVCFARGGFHGTTVADISGAAGCSPGLLYRYFPGKDALIRALVERDGRRYTAWLRAIGSAPDALAALRELLAHVLAELEQPGHAALHLEIHAEAARDPDLAGTVRAVTDDVLTALAEVLRSGQAAGAFDARLDADLTARALLALVDGLTAQHALAPDFAPARHTAAVGLLIENLLTGEAR